MTEELARTQHQTRQDSPVVSLAPVPLHCPSPSEHVTTPAFCALYAYLSSVRSTYRPLKKLHCNSANGTSEHLSLNGPNLETKRGIRRRDFSPFHWELNVEPLAMRSFAIGWTGYWNLFILQRKVRGPYANLCIDSMVRDSSLCQIRMDAGCPRPSRVYLVHSEGASHHSRRGRKSNPGFDRSS